MLSYYFVHSEFSYVEKYYKPWVWFASVPVVKIISFYECSCGRKQGGDFLAGAAPNGLLGLGPGSISVPSLLAKAGLIQNSFSLCLNENGSGRILFGDQGDVTQQRSTPFLPVYGKLYVMFL